MNKKLWILIVFLVLSLFCFSQETKPVFFQCPDLVYYDGDWYSADKSFLSNYSGYKDLFQEKDRPRFTKQQPFVLVWVIENNKIFLVGLDQYHIRNTLNESLKEIETLTKKKLNLSKPRNPILKEIPSYLEIDHSRYAYADWINGTFFIKKEIRKDEPVMDWINAPFWKLDIKNGKIQSKSKWENMRAPVKSSKN